MLELTKTLCGLSGASGYEDEVRDYILERIMPNVDEVITDSMGNIIASKKGAKTPDKKIMFAAHMDEVGVIITRIEDDGYLRFSFLGGIDRRTIIGKKVYIGENKVLGVIGIKAYHMVSREEESKVPELSQMYIDIGAENKEEAEKSVSVADFGCFDPSVYEYGDGYLKAKAIDDRIGCAAMIKLIEGELPYDATFAFTVQEEVGTRGAKIAAARVNPACAIVLEGTTAADLPEVSEGKVICKLGGGIVIPFMDRGTIYTPRLYKMATKIANENGIKWQTKEMIAGGTDASVIQRSNDGVETVALSVPLRNIHTNASVCKISDTENMVKLAVLMLEALGAEKQAWVLNGHGRPMVAPTRY